MSTLARAISAFSPTKKKSICVPLSTARFGPQCPKELLKARKRRKFTMNIETILHQRDNDGVQFYWLYTATVANTGLQVVVKCFDREVIRQDAELKRQARNEIDLYSNLDHPNVTPFYCSFGDGRFIYIVMEAAEEDLAHRLLGLTVSEQVAQDMARHLIAALSYLHSKGLVHRDIKTNNIVVQNSYFGGEPRYQLIDFGLACPMYTPGQPAPEYHQLAGTWEFMAYEYHQVWLENGIVEDVWQVTTPKLDTWGLGVVLYHLIYGCYPFGMPDRVLSQDDDCKISQISAAVMANPLVIPMDPAMSEECKDFLRRCLVKEPDRRADMAELAAHPWFSMGTSARATPTSSFIPVEEIEDLNSPPTLSPAPSSPPPEFMRYWSQQQDRTSSGSSLGSLVIPTSPSSRNLAIFQTPPLSPLSPQHPQHPLGSPSYASPLSPQIPSLPPTPKLAQNRPNLALKIPNGDESLNLRPPSEPFPTSPGRRVIIDVDSTDLSSMNDCHEALSKAMRRSSSSRRQTKENQRPRPKHSNSKCIRDAHFYAPLLSPRRGLRKSSTCHTRRRTSGEKKGGAMFAGVPVRLPDVKLDSVFLDFRPVEECGSPCGEMIAWDRRAVGGLGEEAREKTFALLKQVGGGFGEEARERTLALLKQRQHGGLQRSLSHGGRSRSSGASGRLKSSLGALALAAEELAAEETMRGGWGKDIGGVSSGSKDGEGGADVPIGEGLKSQTTDWEMNGNNESGSRVESAGMREGGGLDSENQAASNSLERGGGASHRTARRSQTERTWDVRVDNILDMGEVGRPTGFNSEERDENQENNEELVSPSLLDEPDLGISYTKLVQARASDGMWQTTDTLPVGFSEGSLVDADRHSRGCSSSIGALTAAGLLSVVNGCGDDHSDESASTPDTASPHGFAPSPLGFAAPSEQQGRAVTNTPELAGDSKTPSQRLVPTCRVSASSAPGGQAIMAAGEVCTASNNGALCLTAVHSGNQSSTSVTTVGGESHPGNDSSQSRISAHQSTCKEQHLAANEDKVAQGTHCMSERASDSPPKKVQLAYGLAVVGGQLGNEDCMHAKEGVDTAAGGDVIQSAEGVNIVVDTGVAVVTGRRSEATGQLPPRPLMAAAMCGCFSWMSQKRR